LSVDRFPQRWDTRVADVMGDHFRFVDDLRTRHTTLRDLLAHRTGLPAYNMALMVGLDPTRSRLDYCRYMALMVGLDPTRSRLDYCRYIWH